MKNKKWMTKISTAIMAAVLCSSVSLQAVMADTDTAPAAETGIVAGTDTEENGSGQEETVSAGESAEDAYDVTAADAPEAPEAPEAPVRPDVEGLEAEEANELISAYNAEVDAYNEKVQAYNAEAEEYEKAKAAYNEAAAVYNEEAEVFNAAAEENNRAEEEKIAASDAKMAEYQQKLEKYNKTQQAIEQRSAEHSALIGTQEETLGNIGRVTKETLGDLGSFLEEEYYVSYGRRKVKLGNPGDLVVRWADLAPTGDHSTIVVNKDGNASGNTYKIANLHIFEDFASMYDFWDYQAEYGYDCMNINIDDANGLFIIPKTMLDRIVVLEYEVAEADVNDTVTVTSQNAVFSSTPNFMTPRFLEGYTAGAYWYNDNVFTSTAAYSEYGITNHTFSYKDGTTDRGPVKNPLNVNQYYWFARYSNPAPVKPEEYKPNLVSLLSPKVLLDRTAGTLEVLTHMELLEILQKAAEESEETKEEQPAVAPLVSGPQSPAPTDTTGTDGTAAAPTDLGGMSAAVQIAEGTIPMAAPAAAESAEETVTATAPAAEEIEESEVPAAAPAVAEIEENEIPMAAPVITEEAVPAAAPAENGAWALINLVCTALSILAALGMILTFFRRKKAQEENGEESSEQKRRGVKFLGILPAAISAVVFLLTEDMSRPMQLTDKWTVLMLVILIGSLVLALVTKNRKQKSEEREAAAAAA